MTHYFLTLLLFATSCVSAHHDFVKYPPKNQQDCMNLFENINSIQAQRKTYMLKMDKSIVRFKSGNMSEKTFRKKREQWLLEENELRTYVTTLYDIGYDHRCF